MSVSVVPGSAMMHCCTSSQTSPIKANVYSPIAWNALCTNPPRELTTGKTPMSVSPWLTARSTPAMSVANTRLGGRFSRWAYRSPASSENEPGSPATAMRTAAAVGLNVFVEVFFSIVIRNFFSLLYFFTGTDVDTFAVEHRFSVGFTGVVDISRGVLAHFAINGVAVIEGEEVFATAPVSLGVWHAVTQVFNKKSTARNVFTGKQAKSGRRAFHDELVFTWSGKGVAHSEGMVL